MKPTIWFRLDSLARQLTPFAITLMLAIVNVVPVHVPGLARVAPVLPLMAVYHWAVYRPELMPTVAVFVIGLVQDVLTGAPIGVNALVFLAVHWGVLGQRRFLYGKSFLIVWLGFAVVGALAAMGGWLLVSVFHVAMVPPTAVLFQYLLTLGGFPLLSWALLRWQQTILGHA